MPFETAAIGEVDDVKALRFRLLVDRLNDAQKLCRVDNLVEDELNQTVDDLYAFAADEASVLSTPRIVQVWGRKG